MRLTRTFVVLSCLCSNIPHAAADPIPVADVAADFSRTNNPNGVWSYGWAVTLGSPFILSSSPGARERIDAWRGNLAPDGNPAAYHNGTRDVIVVATSARYEPGQFGLHPGPNGEYAIVRYVAPITGEASIKSMFVSQDLFETTTDVHVLFNGAFVFDDFVEGVAGSSHVSFARRFSLRQGDTIDFAVGFGRNGTFFNDSTGLAATVTPVPEPSTLFARERRSIDAAWSPVLQRGSRHVKRCDEHLTEMLVYDGASIVSAAAEHLRSAIQTRALERSPAAR